MSQSDEHLADQSLPPESSPQTLLRHPNLWRAGDLRTAHRAAGITTGYATLDAHLPGRGWPGGGLTEFMLPSAGMGELRLLAPALRTLSEQQSRWIAWINPPFIPYAPALEAAGIEIDKILLIHPRNHEDALWALERATRSGSCSCALAWLDERKLKAKDTQRLQLASKQGGTFTCLFRPHAASHHASMAELRIALGQASPGEIRLDIIKRRGGWPVQDLHMPVADLASPKQIRPTDIQEQLSLWRAVQEAKADPGCRDQKSINQSQTNQPSKSQPVEASKSLDGKPALSQQAATPAMPLTGKDFIPKSKRDSGNLSVH